MTPPRRSVQVPDLLQAVDFHAHDAALLEALLRQLAPLAQLREHRPAATGAGELVAIPPRGLDFVSQGGEQYRALFLVGSVLFTFTFDINLLAEMAVSRMRRRLAL